MRVKLLFSTKQSHINKLLDVFINNNWECEED